MLQAAVRTSGVVIGVVATLAVAFAYAMAGESGVADFTPSRSPVSQAQSVSQPQSSVGGRPCLRASCSPAWSCSFAVGHAGRLDADRRHPGSGLSIPVPVASHSATALWVHALRIHRKNLDVRAGPVHRRPDPPDAGTEHIVSGPVDMRGSL